LLVCLGYAALASFALMFVLPIVSMLPFMAWLNDYLGTPLEVVLSLLAICLVLVLGWRVCHYGRKLVVPKRKLLLHSNASHERPVPGRWFRFNLLHALVVLLDGVALWVLMPGLIEWAKNCCWFVGAWRTWVDVPAVVCIPFGLLMSSEFQKQAEQREWPPVASLLLTAFCTLVFTPLYCWSLIWVVHTLFWGLPVVTMVTMVFWFVWLLACSIWGDENMMVRRFLQRHRSGLNAVWRRARLRKTFFRFHLAHLLMVVVAAGLAGMVLSEGAYVAALHRLTPRSMALITFDTGWKACEGHFATHPLQLMLLVATFTILGVVFSVEIARAGERRKWGHETVNALVALMVFIVLPAFLLGTLALLENVVVGFCVLGMETAAMGAAWGMASWILGGEPEEKAHAVRRSRAVRAIHPPVAVPKRPAEGVTRKSKPRPYQPRWVSPQTGNCSVGMRRLNM
jgi:hypothetical protein